MSEEKRRVETESTRQREALHKMQDREQDLSKDIETLRDENSHHSGTISRLQVHCVCVCALLYIQHAKYSGTSLIWTAMGQKKVPLLVRCQRFKCMQE